MSIFNMEDPQSVGLMSLGLRLMSTPGAFGQALGQSGLGAMSDMQGAVQTKQRNDMAKLQIQRAQMEQKAQEDAARRQALIEEAAKLSMRTPEQQALMGGGGPTMENAAKIDPNAGPTFDQGAFLNRLSGIDPLTSLDWRARLAKQTPQPTVSKPGDIARDPVTGKILWQNPEDKAAGDKDLALLEMLHGKGTPAFMAAAAQLAQKRMTHSPAASITNYGAPVPVMLPDGGIGYAQPTNRGGPVAPMTDPAGKPLKKPGDAKDKDLTEAQAKATAFLGQMRSASAELKGLGADQSALSVQAETALAGGPMNAIIGQKAQRIRQSQDQWSEAFLRFKTGAASTEEEVRRNNRTFFPQIGDKPEQVEQKMRMRMQAERDMEVAAGRGTRQLNERDAVGLPDASAIDAELKKRGLK